MNLKNKIKKREKLMMPPSLAKQPFVLFPVMY